MNRPDEPPIHGERNPTKRKRAQVLIAIVLIATATLTAILRTDVALAG